MTLSTAFFDFPHLFGAVVILRQCVVAFRHSETKPLRNRLRVKSPLFNQRV